MASPFLVFAFGGASQAPIRMPAIDLEMLAFDDAEHYDAVLSELIAQQEFVDTLELKDDFRQAPVFRDFANSLGFETLLIYIESQAAAIDIGKEDLSHILDPVESGSHHINHPYLRGILTPQSEMRIGETIFRFQPDGYYKIDFRNLTALSQARRGHAVETEEGATF